MRKIRPFIVLMIVTIALTACPSSTSFPLVDETKGKMDNRLLGSWTTDNLSTAATTVEITESGDDRTFGLEVTEKGSDYEESSTFYTGWTTTIAGKQFVILRTSDLNTYYLYNYAIVGKDKIIIRELNIDKEHTSYDNTEEYQKVIRQTLKKKNPFVEDNVVTYVKNN